MKPPPSKRNGHPSHSILVTADGRPVPTPEQRALAELVQIMRMTARELVRMGVDVNVLMAQPLRRGWARPVYSDGAWRLVLC